MKTQLFIPKKIKVGYQNRDGTYTGKLAHVVYYDMKSWDTWRDKKIKPQEFENVPTEGFVLNKKVGGYKSDWNYRNAHIRVYDPRGFEFEISVANLLFILTQCDCSRGKGLEGKFVYSWDGTELLLLPEQCEAFKQSKSYTVLQTGSVKAKFCVIMYGHSGCGKSYLAEHISDLLNCFICSADHYFETETKWGNKYVFNPKKLGEAHQFCREQFYNEISKGNHVIVDNTNTRLSEWKYYADTAKENKYEVVFVTGQAPWRDNLEKVKEQQLHDVPLSTLEKQIERVKKSKKDRDNYSTISSSQFLDILNEQKISD